METHRRGALIAGFVATTTVLAAQAVQQPPVPAPATPPSSVTISGCLQDAPALAAAGQVAVPAAGPAAGTTTATPAEKAAERAGNVPDPHEGPAAVGERVAIVPGGDRAPSDTRTGRAGAPSRRDAGATANVPVVETSGHIVYYLNAATEGDAKPAAGGVVGTSGLTSHSYRLEGDSAKLAPYLNRQVTIVGTVRAGTPETMRVESVTKLAEKCDMTK